MLKTTKRFLAALCCAAAAAYATGCAGEPIVNITPVPEQTAEGTSAVFETIASEAPAPTEAPTVDKSFFTEPPSEAETEQLTEAPTEPPTEAPTEPPTDPWSAQMSSADGTLLGEWNQDGFVLTEEGAPFKSLLDEAARDTFIYPDASYSVTLDTGKTTSCASILTKYGIEGCIIISDPDGRIQVIANSDDAAIHSTPCDIGSTAKIFVATAIAANGVEQTYSDTGAIVIGGHTFHNWDNTEDAYPAPKERTLVSAFRDSSNAYFMHAVTDLMTYEQVSSVYNTYYAFNTTTGWNDNYVCKTDWTSLLQPNLAAIKDSPISWAQAAIGICNSNRVTPLYLNAVTGAVASGQMHKPYIYTDTTPETAADPLPGNVQTTLWECMRATATSSSLDAAGGYQFYIKTGTADLSETQERMLITGFLANSSEVKSVITLYVRNGADLNYQYASHLAPVYREIAAIAIS